jgi:uncharacterized protein involved in exopolysaccharide biosynthesis
MSAETETTNRPFSLKRFRILLRSQRHLLIFCVLVIGALNAFQTLTEVPLYVSTSKLQLQSFDVARSVDERASAANDVLNDSVRLTNAVLVFQSEVFLNELANELQSRHDKENLVLSWGIGRRLKLSYALYRLGITDVQYQKVDTNLLTPEELGLLLSGMIQVTPVQTDQTIEIKISALEEKTAYAINRAVLAAFMRANQKLDQDQIDSSIDFLKGQAQAAKDRLDAAESKLADYMKSHLNVTTDAATGTFMSEFLTMRMKKQEVERSIEADHQLLADLKTKLKNLDTGGESAGEVLEALKAELLQLKFQRAKLLEQGYPETHPGLMSLERRIASSEEFIQRSQPKDSIDARDVYGIAGYRKDLAGKIIQTQEALTKEELESKGVAERLHEMEIEVNDIPSNEVVVNSMKREVAQTAELYGELTRRLELMRVRSQSSKSMLREVTAPNALTSPNPLPFWPRIVFGFFAGLVFGLSVILLMDTVKPRVAMREDVESSGFQYAGKYRGTADSCAEILAALECIFNRRRENDPTPIVLCGAASPALTLSSFVPLIDYMASRNEHVLLVAEDDTLLPKGYEDYTLVDGVKIYRYPGGKKDLIQVSSAENFGVIKMLLEEYASQYSAVFLFVSRGFESSVYSLCRNIANRILLFGEEGCHTIEDYRNLSAGFTDPRKIYTALLPFEGTHLAYLKARWSKTIFRTKST